MVDEQSDMGLENFNIAPDNKGGRKPKEERDENPYRNVEGEPYTMEHGKDYWKRVWHRFVEGTEADDDEMAMMAHFTHCLPNTVKQNLHEHDIAEYPDSIADLPGKKSRFSTGGSGSTVDEDSTFASIIDAAK